MEAGRSETLIFDLGGVLIENATFVELPKLLPEPIEDHELRRRWLFSPSVQSFERGQMSSSEFAAAFIAEWEARTTPDAFLEAFGSWPRGPYPGALELLDRLRDRFRIVLLSNSNAIHWGKLENVRSRAHASYSSHLLGSVKPETVIFQQVIEDLGVSPEQIRFFDDSPANVAAARQVGMKAYQADSPQAIARILGDARSVLGRPPIRDEGEKHDT